MLVTSVNSYVSTNNGRKEDSMSKKLFVGSLSWNTTDESLQQFFSQAGNVVSAKVITDRESGRSRGFGFVEMSTEEEAQKAVAELNDKELDGRTIKVNEAKPMEDRPRRDFGSRDNRGGDRRPRYNDNRNRY